jgi:hypothetical protein
MNGDMIQGGRMWGRLRPIALAVGGIVACAVVGPVGAEVRTNEVMLVEPGPMPEREWMSQFQAAVGAQVQAWASYQNELASGKTQQHRDVIEAKRRMQRAEDAVRRLERLQRRHFPGAMPQRVSDEIRCRF